MYTASKAGLDAVTGVLAKGTGPAEKSGVNSVNPGATFSEGARTAGLLGTGSDFEKHNLALTPLGRIGTPEDIAKVVAFLASDDVLAGSPAKSFLHPADCDNFRNHHIREETSARLHDPYICHSVSWTEPCLRSTGRPSGPRLERQPIKLLAAYALSRSP